MKRRLVRTLTSLASLTSLATLAMVGSFATSASAQDLPANNIYRDPNSNVTVELRFGPYHPDVDSTFGGTGPYGQVFGDSRRYMIGVEVDYQPVHIPHFGSLGLGLSASYTTASAKAKITARPTVDSGEDTSFSVYPLALLAVLRVDVLARETWVPLVPYLKAGPAVAFWSTGNASGTSNADGVVGKGRTGGYQYALGGMFLLDIFDRQAARTFSVEEGVHHSYFFFEYTVTALHGLGQSNAMHVGDKTWNLGLAMQL